MKHTVFGGPLDGKVFHVNCQPNMKLPEKVMKLLEFEDPPQKLADPDTVKIGNYVHEITKEGKHILRKIA